jgi:hypothetical protein
MKKKTEDIKLVPRHQSAYQRTRSVTRLESIPPAARSNPCTFKKLCKNREQYLDNLRDGEAIVSNIQNTDGASLKLSETQFQKIQNCVV